MKKTQDGFIQIPLLIAIIVTVLVIGGGGYLGVKQYQISQSGGKEPDLSDVQKNEDKDEALAEALREIQNLKDASQEIKRKQGVLEEQVKDQTEKSTQIISPDISQLTKYLTGVGNLSCFNGENYIESNHKSSGTGFLVRSKKRPLIFTNRHVIGDFDSCDFYISPISQRQFDKTVDWLFIRGVQKRAGIISDNLDFVAIPPVDSDTLGGIGSVDILNYQISDLVNSPCSEEIPIGSALYTIGYPAYSTQGESERIILEGRISGYTNWSSLGHKNYFISNRIDSGNSGSPAIAFEDGRFCFAGVVTWISVGDFENQGVVLNFHNITSEI